MQVINKEILNNKVPVERNYSIFDPLIEGSDANYDFAEYVHRRYDLKSLSDELILDPPQRLKDHKNPKEVINFILDKAFVQ